MVNVNGGRDWSAATKDCPDFLGSSTEVKYFTTNPNYGLGPSRPYPERSDPEPVQVLSTLSVNPKIQKSSILKGISQKFHRIRTDQSDDLRAV
jgi:hypothetical protein